MNTCFYSNLYKREKRSRPIIINLFTVSITKGDGGRIGKKKSLVKRGLKKQFLEWIVPRCQVEMDFP